LRRNPFVRIANGIGEKLPKETGAVIRPINQTDECGFLKTFTAAYSPRQPEAHVKKEMPFYYT
jgi:hypothetical protein